MDFISVAEVDGNTYWRHPFNSLCSPRQLEEFIIMDIDIIRNQRLGAGAGLTSNRVKHILKNIHVYMLLLMNRTRTDIVLYI